MFRRFRKKPIIVHAIQYDGTNDVEIMQFTCNHAIVIDNRVHVLPTLEGDMKIDIDDWIIKGVKGEFYPCKPDIFKETYEEV